MNEQIEIDIRDILKEMDEYLSLAGWTKKQGQDYLMSKYGKKSRLQLTDEELLEFLEYCRKLQPLKHLQLHFFAFSNLSYSTRITGK